MHIKTRILILNREIKNKNYVNNPDLKHDGVCAEGPNSGCPAAVLLARHVLGEGGGDDDHILGNTRQLLDTQVHQPPQHRVFRLDEGFSLIFNH